MRENAKTTTSLLLTPLLSATLVLGGSLTGRALAAPAPATDAAATDIASSAPAAIPGVAPEPVEPAANDNAQDPAAAAPEVSQLELDNARRHYAEQFASAAQDALQYYEPGEPLWAYAAALLKAAHRLNPEESRYPRMLADAMIELRDVPGAIKALNDYRAILQASHQDDAVAQCRIIELHLSQMQSLYGTGADGQPVGKIPYLKGIVYNKNSVPAEVKSHAAVLCIPLLLQRSRDEAVEMTRKAVELNPLNLKARQREYELIVAPGGGRLETVQSLLAMIRCNPAQPQVLGALAKQLAHEGLADQSLEWFKHATDVSQMGGGGLDPDVLVEFAVQLFRAKRLQDVDGLTGTLLRLDPRNIDIWFVRLALYRDLGARVDYEQTLDEAQKVMLGRAHAIAKAVESAASNPAGSAPAGNAPAGNAPADAPRPGAAATPPTPAATRPTTGPGFDVPDIDASAVAGDLVQQTIDRLNRGARPDLKGEFISAMADLAWLEVYFYRRPAGAMPWIAALKRMLPAGHQTVTRLEGWSLMESNPAAARASLASIAERDALAALGLVHLLSGDARVAQPATQPATRPALQPATRPAAQPATRPAARPAATPAARVDVAAAPAAQGALSEADVIARRLLEQNPTGVTGMVIDAALRTRRNQVVPRPSPHAEALKNLLGRFPKEWMEIITKPENFYILSGEPKVRAAHKLGEPMLATIKLQNRSNFDIPVGPDGVIKPDLWFDTQVGAAVDRLFPMSGYDRIANLLVLRAKSTDNSITQQVVRVNPGALGWFLRTRPAASLGVVVTVMTNPVPDRDRMVPGPAGLRRLLNRKFMRSEAPVQSDVQKEKIYKILTEDKHLPSDQMLTLDLLTAYVSAARTKGADGRVMSLENELLEQIEKARNDRVPHVAAWATYQAAVVAQQPGEGVRLAETLTKSEHPEVRLLASLTAGALSDTPSGKEEAKRLATALAADKDETVQEAAKAQVKFLSTEHKVRKQFLLPTTQPAGEGAPATQPEGDGGTAGVPVG